ncbi:MAG: GreA/GreB family elongation factor [Verrucomicrobiae bacterium]|nr:GreA/GreB family elongation factor [Verrucomicrobiae bacterium]MCP5549182.1 GreA/GreB family elongation factor [Akkermansiaceae bacterium]
MNPSILLSLEDRTQLVNLANRASPDCLLDADQILILEALLDVAHASHESCVLPCYVGLNDRITLVSDSAPNDSYSFSIVLPLEEDIDTNRIGIGKPVAMACLGRPLGGSAVWIGPRGVCTMKIAHIEKQRAATGVS